MVLHKNLNSKEKKILKYIYSLKAVSRPTLLAMSRYTISTLYRIIDDLISEGLIVVSGTTEDFAKGRPTELLSMNGKAGAIFCIHISRTHFDTGIVDLANDLKAMETHEIGHALTPEELLETAWRDCCHMCGELGISADSIDGVGVSAVGPLDFKRKEMIGATCFNAGNWDHVPIVELTARQFSRPVHLNRNACACLMGHYLPKYYPLYRNMAYITAGMGIGSGLILNRQLLVGSNAILDGLAHMIIDYDGRKCTCGEYGCAEAYASTGAIIRECVRNLKLGRRSVLSDRIDTLTFEDVCDAVKQGDALAEHVVLEAACIFSKCVMNYLQMVDLEAVVLGGRLIEGIPLFYEEVRNIVERRKLGAVVIKELGEDEKILHGIASEMILGYF